ncbi:MAG: TatD family hydrolase [Myxococcota bacterium]|nr:TatD family hydrolase [Myxococcota bacterium]
MVWFRPASWKKTTPMYIDAHCHLDFDAFEPDRVAVIDRAAQRGINRFLVSGVEHAGWARQQRLARAHPGIAWAAGIHPVAVSKSNRAELERWIRSIPDLFSSSRPPAAIGETGLDKHFAPKSSLDLQRFAFRKQIELAQDLSSPLILHIVGCHGAALEILSDYRPSTGMVHSFSGSVEVMKAYLKWGLCISFGTSIMRMNPGRAHALANAVPCDRLLIESDAPDQPIIKGDRNEPTVVIDVAKHIAQLKGCDENEILRQSTTNCEVLLGDRAWS